MFDYSSVDMKAILQRSYDVMSPKQRAAVVHAKGKGRSVSDVWMGLGKTFIGLTAGMCYQPKVWLILCSKNALNGWRQEIKKWYPEFGSDDLYCIVRGQKAQREAMWNAAARREGLFYATTFGSFIRDIDYLVANKIKFEVITIDEPQKGGLRNRKTAGFKAVKAISTHRYYEGVKLIWMGTGTLTSKGVPQLFGYLHILAPKIFSSHWKFINMFMNVVQGPFGTEAVSPKNTELLAKLTAPYIYKVSKKEAEDELPPLRRVRLHTELTPKLAAIYHTMASELFMAWEGLDGESKFLSVANPIGATVKLRQLICCPAILDPALGPGPAIEVVADKIMENDELPNWRHNVIFTPFVPSIEVFKRYLAETLGMPPAKIMTLQGGAEPEYLQHVEETFRNDPDTMVISSLKFAQSFNLETGLNAYFPHFEWDQDDNTQAEARIRRKTSDQSRTIMSYYVTIEQTITEIMFEILNRKTHHEKITYQDFERIRQMLTQKIIGAT